MICQCGHPTICHARKRSCQGQIRLYLGSIPDPRPQDRFLTKEEADVVLQEARAKVERAPSYERAYKKLLRRGYVEVDCPCEIFHTLELPEESEVKLWGPGGRQLF